MQDSALPALRLVSGSIECLAGCSDVPIYLHGMCMGVSRVMLLCTLGSNISSATFPPLPHIVALWK